MKRRFTIDDAVNTAAAAGSKVTVGGDRFTTAEEVARSHTSSKGFGIGVDRETGVISLFFIRDRRVAAEQTINVAEAEALGQAFLAFVDDCRARGKA